jgi:two-component system CheB/CheR fusion protein
VPGANSDSGLVASSQPDQVDRRAARCPVVALGASAGGLDAFERFFRACGPLGAALVVVQHLAPEHESILPQLLSSFTRMPVEAVVDGTLPLPDHVYVIPANATLLLRDGRLRLSALEPRASRQPISAFFTSLAYEHGRAAVAVVLSGTGSDGAAGIHAVRSRGGLTLAQAPSEAHHDAMPRSAVATGDVEFVASADDMPRLIARELERRKALQADEPPELDASSDPLVGITNCLRSRTGHDFGAFKRSTLQRRVQRRLAALGLATTSEYLARLQVDDAEANALACDLMIGVTSFFRDRDAFEVLERDVLPQLHEFAGERAIRVWVPGCASGEEAYSIAILLLEHRRGLPAREGPPASIQVFATDIDERSLALARIGQYPPSSLSNVPAEWRERYFTLEDGRYVISKEVRDCCIFSGHDVIRDPPFSRIDLVSCRNLLIYFGPETQARLLPLFHYALRAGGFLFLGSSETLGDCDQLFHVVNKKHRVFRRRDQLARPATLALPLAVTPRQRLLEPPRDRAEEERAAVGLLQSALEALLEERGAALAVVDRRGNASYFAGPVSRYLPTRSGAPSTNVLDLASGDLRLEISAALLTVGAGCGRIRREVAPSQEGAPRVELMVKPLLEPGAARDHVLLVLRECEEPRDAAGGVAGGEHHDGLEEELRLATERWRRTVQELESANEQARSANEELHTMNEELQSSNEELQLSQEELQSINEELNTVNAELTKKVEEVNVLYADLRNLFESTRIATIFIDDELRIARFTPAAAKLYPMTDRDVGRPLQDLVSPFSDVHVVAEARAVLDDLRPREHILSLADGSGWRLLRLLPYRSLAKVVTGVVLTFVDVTALKRAEAALQDAKELERRRASELEAIMRSVPAAVWIAEDAGATRIVGNDTARHLMRLSPPEDGSCLPVDLPGGARVLHGGRELWPEEMPLRHAASTGEVVRGYEEEVHFADGTHIHLFGHAAPLLDDAGRPSGAVAAFLDITPLKDVEEALRASEARFRGSIEALLDAFAVFRPIVGSDRLPVDFEIEHLNAAARTILNLPRDAVRCRLREVLPERSPLFDVLSDATRRDAAVERHGLRGDGPEGTDHRVYDLRACALGDVIVVAWRDVSDRTRAVEALREADRRKDEFLAVLGHELRNPLAAIQTVLHLADRAPERSPRLRQHLELMRRQSRALGRLVDDLLDLTRITRGKIQLHMAPVDLGEVVRSELDIHRQAAADRLTLRLVEPDRPLWVNGDQERIAQMVGNLLGNACKFTDAGGAVEVTLAPPDDEGRVMLTVRDEGIGMTPETLAHLFEPFRQADRSLDRARGGLGLGLSLVKALAVMMGADVAARSDGLGHGSAFTLRFASASPPAKKGGEAATMARGRRLRILVVEDNRDVGESLAEFLAEELGHEVTLAADGESGVDKARSWIPDLVLCDIGLPGLDGFEVARALRRDAAMGRTILVALTGYGREEDKARAIGAGFDHHATKPFDLREFEQWLNEVFPAEER